MSKLEIKRDSYSSNNTFFHLRPESHSAPGKFPYAEIVGFTLIALLIGIRLLAR